MIGLMKSTYHCLGLSAEKSGADLNSILANEMKFYLIRFILLHYSNWSSLTFHCAVYEFMTESSIFIVMSWMYFFKRVILLASTSPFIPEIQSFYIRWLIYLTAEPTSLIRNLKVLSKNSLLWLKSFSLKISSLNSSAERITKVIRPLFKLRIGVKKLYLPRRKQFNNSLFTNIRLFLLGIVQNWWLLLSRSIQTCDWSLDWASLRVKTAEILGVKPISKNWI